METIYKIDRRNAAYCYPLLEPSDLEETFLQLVEQWRRETGMMSLVTKMVMHPAYQRIIGMGQPVVPLIHLNWVLVASKMLAHQRSHHY